jgi:hypothetical protein
MFGTFVHLVSFAVKFCKPPDSRDFPPFPGNSRLSRKNFHRSGKDVADDVAMNVSQPAVDAVVVERQLFVIDTE